MVAGGRQASSPVAGSAEPRSGCRARTLGAAAGPAARSAPSLRQWLLALTRNGAQLARAGARAAVTLGGGGGASHIRAPPRPAPPSRRRRSAAAAFAAGGGGGERDKMAAALRVWVGGGCAGAVVASSLGVFAGSPCAILFSCGVCYISLVAGALASFSFLVLFHKIK